VLVVIATLLFLALAGGPLGPHDIVPGYRDMVEKPFTGVSPVAMCGAISAKTSGASAGMGSRRQFLGFRLLFSSRPRSLLLCLAERNGRSEAKCESNRHSLAPNAVIKRLRLCRPTLVGSFMIAEAAAQS
jgi:hypothetical protein